jgi:hypothetical protein
MRFARASNAALTRSSSPSEDGVHPARLAVVTMVPPSYPCVKLGGEADGRGTGPKAYAPRRLRVARLWQSEQTVSTFDHLSKVEAPGHALWADARKYCHNGAWGSFQQAAWARPGVHEGDHGPSRRPPRNHRYAGEMHCGAGIRVLWGQRWPCLPFFAHRERYCHNGGMTRPTISARLPRNG